MSCDLKSSYGDFYSDRIDLITEQSLDSIRRTFEHLYSHNSLYINSPCTLVENSFDLNSIFKATSILDNNISDLTFWNIVFFYSKLTNASEWHLIEQRIHDFLVPLDNVDSIITMMSSDHTNFRLTKLSSTTHMNEITAAGMIKLAMAIAKKYFPKERYADKTIEEFLLNELKQLEKDFNVYLDNNVISNRTSYIDKQVNLLRNIINGNHSVNNKQASILTFNYTSIPVNDKNQRIENVHGSLKNHDIIFGIDQKNIDFNDYAYKYTKTFRQMISNNHKNRKETILPNKDKIDCIKFLE